MSFHFQDGNTSSLFFHDRECNLLKDCKCKLRVQRGRNTIPDEEKKGYSIELNFHGAFVELLVQNY